MTTSTLETAVDPTGLGGQRLSRSDAHAPHIEVCWLYSTAHSLDAIRAAWKALPRQGRTLVIAVTEFKPASAGRRFVKIDFYTDTEASS